MNIQVPLLGFDSHGNWIGMDSETMRDFADSFIDVDNFVSEEAIVSASSVMTLALIWYGYPQSWVYSDFKVVFEGLLRRYNQDL
jgi:hypothetical protein